MRDRVQPPQLRVEAAQVLLGDVPVGERLDPRRREHPRRDDRVEDERRERARLDLSVGEPRRHLVAQLAELGVTEHTATDPRRQDAVAVGVAHDRVG